MIWDGLLMITNSDDHWLLLDVGNGWVAGGCWGLLGVAGMIITSDDWDHSRNFPAFSTSKLTCSVFLSITYLRYHAKTKRNQLVGTVDILIIAKDWRIKLPIQDWPSILPMVVIAQGRLLSRERSANICASFSCGLSRIQTCSPWLGTFGSFELGRLHKE